MSKISDHDLIEELKNRFLQNKKVLEEQKRLAEELQKLNKKLEDSEKVKSHFLSNIKNEINNPLASILALSSNIHIMNHLKPEQIIHTASMIHAEAFSLDFQLRNIFSAAEIEAGDCDPQYNKVDVSSVVNSLIESYTHLLRIKDITVEFKISGFEKDNFFITDSSFLQLILTNLINNAIKFSNKNSKIVLTVDKSSKGLLIKFRDFGSGIPKEKQIEIFDRFKQLETGTTKAYQGHGLGLSVTKALLEMLNGTISLEAEVSEGSCFSIFIPEPNIEFLPEDFASDGNEFFFDADESF